MYGYAGRILHVDLSKEEIYEESLDEGLIEDFIGGWGINNKLFYDESTPKTDPFSEDSPIIIGTGALVGTLIPGASKIISTYRSPIVSKDKKHFIDNSVAGSNRFGIMLKNSGFDHIVISGKAHAPVYLKISDCGCELCDATGLWGDKDIYETTDYLNCKYGDCGVIAIGQAGENRIRYAMSIVDYCGSFGKFGFGAVMGSKNLKAIVTKGSKGIEVADPKEYLRLVNEIRKEIEESHSTVLGPFRMLGIMSGWPLQGPLANEGYWSFKEWTKLYGQQKWMKIKMRKQDLSCVNCMLACRVDYQLKDGEFEGLTSFSGSYFMPARMGQRLGIRNFKESVKLLDICNRAGTCCLTTSGIVNWVTQLYEDGELDEDMISELKLNRDFEAYKSLFEKIVIREGIGDLLAEGWYPISERVGSDPDEFTPGTGIRRGADCIQDIRFTTLDPQRFTYFTNPRPHHGGTQTAITLPKMPLEVLKEDVRNMGIDGDLFDRIFTKTDYYGDFNCAIYAKQCEDVMAVQNSLGICIVYAIPPFLTLNMKKLAPIYSAATGIEVSANDLRECGERAFNLYKVLNMREGFTREDDACSNIWLTPRDTPDGVKQVMDYYRNKEITKEDIDHLLNDYYTERGWDVKAGAPTKELLIELKLPTDLT
ncbi:MAG: aldehyde ferredoxin oxidoreductase N-terminal domain-containing protein [Halobacteriota archaeon]|nr:aldehyde ferredoxin oxidoreductase N-terminal domain-containing protein [Halobacteriota archaeon]